jgi:Fe(3+) dicitrate transport protein
MDLFEVELSKHSRAWLWYKGLVLVVLIAGSCLSAFAQSSAKERECLCGIVTDQNGATIQGVSVTSKADGSVVITDQSGFFEFPNSASAGRVVVTARGFREVTLNLRFEGVQSIILETIVIVESVSVTGSDTPGSPDALLRIPGSYQLIDSKTLETSRVFDFAEVLRKISGVVIRDEEGFGLRPNIGIRGTNPSRSTKVLLLEDGIPLAYAPYGDNASYYHPPVERFESVEVLKGSGQIEYGPVTVGGVINYLTPNPTDERRFSLKTIGGNRNFFNGNALLSGKDFGIGYFVNFNRKQGQGARDNVRTGLNDFSLKVVRTLGGRQQLSGKFSILDEDSRVTYSGLTLSEYQEDPRQNPFRNDRFEGRRYGFSATHSGVWTSSLSSSTTFYYSRFNRDWWRQSSNSSQRPNRRFVDADCLSMTDLNTTCGNEGRLRNYRTVGLEPRFTAEFNLGATKHEVKFGFRVHGEIQSRLQLNGETPLARTGIVAEDNFRRNTALAGFIHHRIRFGKMAIVSGLRVEDISYERRNRINSASGRTKVTQVIPGVGVTFNPTDKTTFFAGVHRGFAPPRTEDIITNSGGLVDLDSEKSWNYESGVRVRATKAVSLDMTWFRTDYENQIVAASVAGGVGSVFTNGGKTQHQGMEVSGRFDSMRAFDTGYNFYVALNYTNIWDAKFIGDRFSSLTGFTAVSVSGNRIPYAPRNTLNLGLGFEYKNIDVILENNSVSRQFGDDLNTVDPIANGQRGALTGQTYWNGTVNYKIERLKSTVFVTVKNAFDRTFVVDRSRGMIPSSPRLVQSGIKVSF